MIQKINVWLNKCMCVVVGSKAGWDKSAEDCCSGPWKQSQESL